MFVRLSGWVVVESATRRCYYVTLLSLSSWVGGMPLNLLYLRNLKPTNSSWRVSLGSQ